MRLGIVRYGPFAPFAFQFGKYDERTTAGVSVRSTSKEIFPDDVRILLTFVVGTDGCFRAIRKASLSVFGQGSAGSSSRIRGLVVSDRVPLALRSVDEGGADTGAIGTAFAALHKQVRIVVNVREFADR